MPLLYAIDTGNLYKEAIRIGRGYSGHGEGLNNPAMTNVKDVGPLPEGWWTIEGPPFDSPKHGPYVMRLTPEDDTETFGRDEFEMHGDEIEHPGEFQASHGCLVMDRPIRSRVWQCGERRLQAVAKDPYACASPS